MSVEEIGISINGTGIGDVHPVRIMGILNLSGESFYKASVVGSDTISAQAQRMIGAGATMLDVGGRSTAPHAAVISVDEERARVNAALESLFTECDTGGVLVSIDTQHTEVGESALDVFARHGKENSFLINDVSCLATDPRMASWISEIRRPLIIMASHSVPGDSLGVGQTIDDLRSAIDKLGAHGFDVGSMLIVDPAIGHWIPEKAADCDCRLVARLRDFRVLGCPILAGISRKSFVGSITGAKDPQDRLPGTLSATAIAVFNGAHIIRTHDVTRDTSDTVLVASAIRRMYPGGEGRECSGH
jgi:dihydropteroate synthase